MENIFSFAKKDIPQSFFVIEGLKNYYYHKTWPTSVSWDMCWSLELPVPGDSFIGEERRKVGDEEQ